MYAKPEFDYRQMFEIRLGLENGLTTPFLEGNEKQTLLDTGKFVGSKKDVRALVETEMAEEYGIDFEDLKTDAMNNPARDDSGQRTPQQTRDEPQQADDACL